MRPLRTPVSAGVEIPTSCNIQAIFVAGAQIMIAGSTVTLVLQVCFSLSETDSQ